MSLFVAFKSIRMTGGEKLRMLAVVLPFSPLSSGTVSFQDPQFQWEALSSWYSYACVAGREALTTEKSLVFTALHSLVGETSLGFGKGGDSAALQWLRCPDFTDGTSLESSILYVFTHRDS